MATEGSNEGTSTSGTGKSSRMEPAGGRRPIVELQGPLKPQQLPLFVGAGSPAELTPTREQIEAYLKENPAPRPLEGMHPNSLLASGTLVNSTKTADPGFRKAYAAQSKEWQLDAWAMYDLVGELAFVVDNTSSRGSKAQFYVGKLGENQTDSPERVTDASLKGLLDSIGGGRSGMSRLVERLMQNLKVPGEGWLVGIPTALLPAEENPAFDEGSKVKAAADRQNSGTSGSADSDEPKTSQYAPPGTIGAPKKVDRESQRPEHDRSRGLKSGRDLEDYVWKMMSVSEVSFDNAGKAVLDLGPMSTEKLEVNPDDLFLIRIHKPHPERAWQATSATRSSLSVLRELVGLTMHISAQIDSRLAGAGVFIVPESYARAVKRAMGLPDDSPQDPVTDGLMATMLTPIGDRAHASALVPLVLTVPDEAADKFRHITFDKGLDTTALGLRSESIRRLALSQDCPPELLLGTGGMNHWGGWLMREDVVRAHIEPTLALICDALTVQYLRPMIRENFPDVDADEYVIWYDVEHLIIRASNGADAKDLYNSDELSGEALRRANGFDENDAPEKADTKRRAQEAVFEMVQANPGLLRRPGIDVLVRQMEALLNGNPLGAEDLVAQAAQSESEAQDVEEATGVEVETDGTNGEDGGDDAASTSPDSSPTASSSSSSARKAPASAAGVDSTPGTSGGPPKTPAELALENYVPPPVEGLSFTDVATLGVKGSLSNTFSKVRREDEA